MCDFGLGKKPGMAVVQAYVLVSITLAFADSFFFIDRPRSGVCRTFAMKRF